MPAEKAKALLNQAAQQILFMENRGQVLDQHGKARRDVLFMARSGGLKVALRANGISYQFEKAHYKGAGKAEKNAQPRGPDAEVREMESVESQRLDMYLEGANPAPEVLREAGSDYTENYYNIPSAPEGITDVRAWTRIRLKDVYPGIDWVLYTQNDGKMKYDFIVRPGADPAQIRMRYAGGAELRIDRGGALMVNTPLGEISEQAPVSYQDGKEIPSRFVLDGDVLSFAFTGYDPARTLTVDPLVWATYYGGTGFDGSFSTAVDASGNVYLAGETQSSTGIASGGHQNTIEGTSDAFLVKFNASGARQWATYYGGMGNELGWSTAVDASGNVYLSGRTDSGTGIASGGHQNTYGGGIDAFLVKFNPSGARQWATYYGGTGEEQGYSTAVDASGFVYLAGWASSNTGIASGGYQTNFGGNYDAFLVKFDASGARQWATYYGQGRLVLKRSV